MGPRRKGKNIGSTFDSWLREEGIQEEVIAKAIDRTAARRDVAAMVQKGLSESQTAKAYKSRAMAELHQNVRDLHRLGLIDKKTMRKFVVACLASPRNPARTSSK